MKERNLNLKKKLRKISIIYLLFVLVIINLFLATETFAFNVNEIQSPEV